MIQIQIQSEIDYQQEQVLIILNETEHKIENLKFNSMLDSVQFDVLDKEYVMTHQNHHYYDVESVRWCSWEMEILLNPKDELDIFCSYVDEDGNILGEDKLQWNEFFSNEQLFAELKDVMIELRKLQDEQLAAEVMA